MKTNYLFLLFLPVLAAGCSQVDVIDEISESSLIDTTEESDETVISQSRAIEMAEDFFDIIQVSRSGQRTPSDIEYVLKQSISRSGNDLPDTLAYIINYADNQGFAIIANSTKVKAPLAFSDTGNFSLAFEPTNENFIRRIEPYLSKLNAENTNSDEIEIYDPPKIIPCIIPNKLKVHPHQRDPWDKYVIINHPGCPVGCVPLAVTNIMLHAKDSFKFNGETIYAKAIIDAIHDAHSLPGSLNNDKKFETNGTGGFVYPDTIPIQVWYTWQKGTDLFAKMLSDVGEKMKVTYDIKGTGSLGRNALPVLRECGFDIQPATSSIILYYAFMTAFTYVRDGYILYMEGRQSGTTDGHAWVVDGGMYTYYSTDKSKIINAWIHCDWGHGGAHNGLFSGQVFEISEEDKIYYPDQYIAIKDESTNQTLTDIQL